MAIERRPPAKEPAGPSTTAVYWKYLIFWVLFFSLIFLISLFGVVAEA